MTWTKKGFIWNSSSQGELGTHSMIPTPILLKELHLIRIYFSIRDSKGRALPYYIEVDAENPFRVITKPQGPLLQLGQPGTFDANGLAVCSVVETNNAEIYMYYVGFEIPSDIRYRMFTGLAISNDGGRTFQKHSETPILDRSHTELFFRCGPFVRQERGIYKMWYVAGSKWLDIDGTITPEYSLKYLESSNGINWPVKGEELIAPDGDSYAYGRPWLHELNENEHLVVSTRKKSTKSYQIENFIAKQTNLFEQIETALPLGKEGESDNEMITYASILKYKDQNYCFYNGNDFGREGILFATFH